MDLSPEVVAGIVALLQDGRSQCYVSRRFGCSRSTVQRVYLRFLETGSYARRPGSSRPRISSNRDDRFITNLSLRNRHLTAVQIRNELQHVRNVNISERTVRRRLNEANLFCRRPATGPELTREHRVARLRFAREHRHWTENEWANVLFTDESRYCLRSSDGRERVWRRRGERYAECTFSAKVSFQGGSVMVWGGISAETRTQLYVLQRGTLNAERYVRDILEPHVAPHRYLIGANFLLMQDNARPHVARVVQEYLNEENIQKMEWPAHSPDLNPIEHLWDGLGKRTRALVPAPATLEELRRALLEQWAAVPQEDIRRLVASMPRRMEAVIQARGGNTRY